MTSVPDAVAYTARSCLAWASAICAQTSTWTWSGCGRIDPWHNISEMCYRRHASLACCERLARGPRRTDSNDPSRWVCTLHFQQREADTLSRGCKCQRGHYFAKLRMDHVHARTHARTHARVASCLLNCPCMLCGQGVWDVFWGGESQDRGCACTLAMAMRSFSLMMSSFDRVAILCADTVSYME